MVRLFFIVWVVVIAANASAKDITKDEFIKDGKNKITKKLCNSEKFLSCTGHANSLCKAQMKVVILPHCIQSKLQQLPNQLTNQQTKQAATTFAKCAAISYAAFSQLDLDNFGRCMAK